MNVPSGGPLRSILVLGDGPVGLSAALAFARALPRTAVALVATPSRPAALADRLPAMLPATLDMLDRLGLGEDDLLRAGAATHRLADRFVDWRDDASDWLHGFGDTGLPIDGAAFHHHWIEARRARVAAPFHAFSAAIALAAADRFAPPADDPGALLSRFGYALRLEPGAARHLLATRARASGVAILPGPVSAVSRSADGTASAVTLPDGRTLSPDLFIDCSGSTALLGDAGGWKSWADALRIDRLLLAAAPGTPALLDEYRAVETGWRASWPMRNQRLIGLGYAAAVTSEARARRIMGTTGAAAEAIAFSPGRQRRPWRGNVLALGDAAVATGPMGWTGLAVAHADLASALDLLPGRDLQPLLLAEYNRQAALRAGRVRDFLALHHLAAMRRAGPFWRAAGNATLPPDLALTLATFKRSGHLPRFEQELFDKQSWLSVVLGLGILPERRHATAKALDSDVLGSTLARLQADIAALPAHLPSYADYLGRRQAA